MAFLLQSDFGYDAVAFKIFGFDLSKLASLRSPPSRPSYQPRPTYQEIPEPPPPQIEQTAEYAYRQPEYNSVYSDHFESSPQQQQDVYDSPVVEPQSYEEHPKIGTFTSENSKYYPTFSKLH